MARGGHCSVSCGSSFSRLRRKVVTKHAGAAIVQRRNDTEGRAYYERKRAAGKTNREALRCLKRRLSDLVFQTMRQDAAKPTAQERHSPVVRNTQRQNRDPAQLQKAVGAGDANEARLTA